MGEEKGGLDVLAWLEWTAEKLIEDANVRGSAYPYELAAQCIREAERERDEALKREKRLIQAGNLMATSIERAWARNAKDKAREWRELCAALEGEGK